MLWPCEGMPCRDVPPRTSGQGFAPAEKVFAKPGFAKCKAYPGIWKNLKEGMRYI